MNDEGAKFKAALEAWMGSEEGVKCRSETASGQYLYNRLFRAFDAGWEAAKRQFAAVGSDKK